MTIKEIQIPEKEPMTFTGVTFTADVIVNGVLVKAGTHIPLASPGGGEADAQDIIERCARAVIESWHTHESCHPKSDEACLLHAADRVRALKGEYVEEQCTKK